MANKNPDPRLENLTPFHEMSEERAREIRSKGGKRSQEVQRERKTMRKQAELLLSLPLKDKAAKKKLKELGIDKEEIDNQMLIVLQLWRRAASGDLEATKLLMDLLGETATQVKISGDINNPFKDLSTEELKALIASE